MYKTAIAGFLKRRFPEPIDRFETLKWIWDELLNDRGRKKSSMLLFIILLSAAASVAQPYGIGLLFRAVDEKEFVFLYAGIGFLAAFGFVELGLRWWRQYIREQVFNVNIWHIPMMLTRAYFGKTLGELVAEDAEIDGGGVESTRDKIWTIQDRVLFDVSPNAATALFALIACTWVGPTFGLAVLGYIFIDLLFSYKQNNYMHRVLDPIDREFRRWNRRVRARWADVTTVKYNGVERRVEDDLSREIIPPITADFEVWGKWFPKRLFIQKSFGTLCRLSIYLYAGVLALEGRVAIEGLTLLVFSLERIANSLQEISDSQRTVQENLIRVRAYRDALTKKPHFDYAKGETFVHSGNGIAIEICDVEHLIGERETPILSGVSLSVARGEHVGIIGLSGAGKSVLMNLILRAYDPKKGVMLWEGKDIRSYSLESLCRYVGHVPQSAEVFEGTIRENVCFGLPHERLVAITDDDVWAAITKSGLDFGGRLHDGLDTRIGYKGMRLSGGERQRLTIARAYIKDPGILILDEPTSALDSVSEEGVLEAFYSSLTRGTTAIMIAHRLSTLVRCTKIVFVRPLDRIKEDEVQVTVHGSMQELYEHDPLFREMADKQGFRPCAYTK